MKPIQITLCCGGKKCPVLTIEEHQAVLTDDFGGKVLLTHQQLELLKKELNEHT